ncbi:ABC transporter ATP-binding protein [Corynebacterium sp. LK2510]|uniref:ABC transporter ATP-binding protein n=1 Tax=Corynebacterium sp. LK2510 TaxID=3110472 RepID=UPI0034CD6A77
MDSKETMGVASVLKNPPDAGASEVAGTDSHPDYQEEHRAGKAAIKRLQRPIRGRLLVSQLLVAISGALAIAPYIALFELGEIFLAGHHSGAVDTEKAWSVAFFLVSVFCLRLFVYFIALLVSHFADLKLRDLMRRRIVDRLGRVRLSWFTESNSGALRKAIQDDTATVHTVIAHGPIDLLNAVVTPLMLFALSIYVDWRLALLSIATIPLFVAFYSVAMRGMSERTAELNVKLDKVSSTMVEFVAGIGVVKAFGQVGRAHSRYLDAAEEFNEFYRGWSLPLVSMCCIAQSWISVAVILLVNLGGGGLLLHAGYVNVVQVITCTLIALVLPGALNAIASIGWAYQLAGAAAVRLCALLDTEELPFLEKGGEPNGNHVSIRNVSYSYSTSSPTETVAKATNSLAVDDVSLDLAPGAVTALIGPSGSGKTTLATLIARFDDPSSGVITLGGQDLKALDSATLYSNVGFVLQDPQLLNTSIRNNIALGSKSCSDLRITQAARDAQIHDFIMSLPKGYDTVVGTDTRLSGGQQQRLAIARALVKDAPVLILDEATAFADPESEAEIQKALSRLVKDRTVLVIAHRPTVVKGANQIVVLEKGRVEVIGTHKELLQNHHYRKLLAESGAQGGL